MNYPFPVFHFVSSLEITLSEIYHIMFTAQNENESKSRPVSLWNFFTTKFFNFKNRKLDLASQPRYLKIPVLS